mgnify:FL=1
MKLKIVLLILFVSITTLVNAQTEAFTKKSYIKDNDTLNYRLLLPKDFSEDKQYPVVLFLHGAGERGKTTSTW